MPDYPRYHVHGLVGREATLRQTLAAAGLRSAQLLPLRFGLALVPASDELLAELAGDLTPISVDFVRLSPALARLGREASAHGPVAYLEAESEDGTGFHAALVWNHGDGAYGPLNVEGRRPVNQALHLLGVASAAGQDEFTTLGIAALC